LSDLAAPARSIAEAAIGSLCTACVVRVERRGEVDELATGTLCPDPRAGPDAPCTVDALFDLASLTKLATTALVLSFVKDKVLTLDTPFSEVVPDFHGGRKDDVTLTHVLTHTAGLKWWLPLWKEAQSRQEAIWRAAQEPLAQDLVSPGVGRTVEYRIDLEVRLCVGYRGVHPLAVFEQEEISEERCLGPAEPAFAVRGPEILGVPDRFLGAVVEVVAEAGPTWDLNSIATRSLRSATTSRSHFFSGR